MRSDGLWSATELAVVWLLFALVGALAGLSLAHLSALPPEVPCDCDR